MTCSAFWDMLESYGLLSLNVRVHGTTKTQPLWTDSDQAWADTLIQMLEHWAQANSVVTPLVVTVGSSPIVPRLADALSKYPRRSHTTQPIAAQMAHANDSGDRCWRPCSEVTVALAACLNAAMPVWRKVMPEDCATSGRGALTAVAIDTSAAPPAQSTSERAGNPPGRLSPAKRLLSLIPR